MGGFSSVCRRGVEGEGSGWAEGEDGYGAVKVSIVLTGGAFLGKLSMKISKLDAAQIQLDAAIMHFFDNEHVPAVTLAGAAEDLLAGLLKASGKQTAFEFLHKWYEETYETKVTTQSFSRQIANPARNWLKHANDDPDTCTTISEQDSIMMLMRALPCYFKLTQKHTAQMDRFFQYVRNNISDINKMFS